MGLRVGNYAHIKKRNMPSGPLSKRCMSFGRGPIHYEISVFEHSEYNCISGISRIVAKRNFFLANYCAKKITSTRFAYIGSRYVNIFKKCVVLSN